MPDYLSFADAQIIDRDNRNTQSASVGPMSAIINDLASMIDAGSVGIEAASKDVDAIALGGGAISHNPDTTSGLTLGFTAGRVYFGPSLVNVSAGTVLLTTSATNYVEVDAAGAVSANTSAFTAGRCPLWIVTTGVSSIATFTQRRTLLFCFPDASITGTQLSTAGKTKTVTAGGDTLSATGTVKIPLPNVAGTITAIRLNVDTTVAANDTNYWTFTAVNKGPAGTGTTDVLALSDANTTKLTGGSALTNFVQRALTLHGTGANLIVAAGDVLLLTATKTASGANLVVLQVQVDVAFTA